MMWWQSLTLSCGRPVVFLPFLLLVAKIFSLEGSGPDGTSFPGEGRVASGMRKSNNEPGVEA